MELSILCTIVSPFPLSFCAVLMQRPVNQSALAAQYLPNYPDRSLRTSLHTSALEPVRPGTRLTHIPSQITTFGDVSYVPAFLDLLMSILNADFLLNLQKAASSSSSSYADSAQLGSGGLPSLNFAAISQSNHAGFAADADDVSLPEASPGA
ncbi:hypothetical protein C8Q70DRAFT_292691 [Cubamyces menziesii]|nr:hypothetical protein C8Q70DRAFT_292691 [Cubamyces menziesii]